MQACDERINQIRRDLNLPEKVEFHFCKTCSRVRTYFLKEVSRYEFFYLALVLNKARLSGPGLQFKDSLYKYTVNLLFQNAKPYLSNAIVVVDRTGRKEFRSQLSRYLARRIHDDSGVRYIKKVKTQSSRNNNLLQLSDMVCGAVARCYRANRKNRSYRDIIRHRELELQVWPK